MTRVELLKTKSSKPYPGLLNVETCLRVFCNYDDQSPDVKLLVTRCRPKSFDVQHPGQTDLRKHIGYSSLTKM